MTTERASAGRRSWWTARTRILGWYVGLLAVATLASVLLLREALVNRMDVRIEESLVQEADELGQLVRRGVDPATGQRFGTDVRVVFRTFFESTVPNRGEAFLAIVEGAPFLITADAPVALDRQPELVERWAAATGAGLRSEVATAAGPARTLAVPLESDDATSGVFVIAYFLAIEQREVDEAVRTAAVISATVLVAATVLAWFVAGRVLAPVRLVTDTARRITESDLSGRIPVRGSDDIAELTETFNAMVDRLQTAFEAQQQFVDDAGHELRTPITIVRGHLEVMGDDVDERRETVALVTDELDRMARIVNELLLLAKVGSADFLHLEAVEIDPFLDEVCDKAARLGDRRWRVDHAGPGCVVADRQRLTQVVVNLLVNAVQHTADGDEIALGARLDGREVELSVADTGPGVAVEDRVHIFERFGRATASRRRSDGAGLGLAIVSAVVAAHGGRVALDPVPGHGARFTVTLPVEGPRTSDADARRRLP